MGTTVGPLERERRSYDDVGAAPHRSADGSYDPLEPPPSVRAGERIALDELAREVAAWEQGYPIAEVDRCVRRRIATSLVHDHLPRLDDHDVIEYARRESEVVLTTAVDEQELVGEALELDTF